MPDLCAALPTHLPYSGRTAQCPQMRALRAAFPARSPLLPALTRSLRAASAFLTSPPQQDKRARSGTLRLYYTNKQTEGETNPETHWRTRNRPRPRKNTAPVPGSPDPSCLPPKTTTDPAAQMTGESAQHRPRIPRRTCRTRKLQGARGTRETPQSPGFPGSPGPPPALPPPEGALRAPRSTRIPCRPGQPGNRHPARRHPGTAPTSPPRKQPQVRRKAVPQRPMPGLASGRRRRR